MQLKKLNKRFNQATRQRKLEKQLARKENKQVTQSKDSMPSIRDFSGYARWALGASISPRKPDDIQAVKDLFKGMK